MTPSEKNQAFFLSPGTNLDKVTAVPRLPRHRETYRVSKGSVNKESEGFSGRD